MSLTGIDINKKLVPTNYLDLAKQAHKIREKEKCELLEKRKIPKNGWSEPQIEELLNTLSALDSNNYVNKAGLGEREGRILCNIVARRHFNFTHGIGRSGDLLEAQPKAVGCTIVNNLTNSLLLDLFHLQGLKSCKRCLIVPMATGMSLTLCMLSLKRRKPNAVYVIWSRIDQKSCFKSILAAGLTPIIVEPLRDLSNGSLQTNIEEIGFHMKSNADKILCVMTTSSCFAPRNADDVFRVGEMAKIYNISHIVNNAYGLQSRSLLQKLEKAGQKGYINLIVQSTDKNLLVPVGGAIVAGFDETEIENVAKFYPGRASISQSLDVLITLLAVGKNGYLKVVEERTSCFDYLKQKLEEFAVEHNTKIIVCKDNPISMAILLDADANSGTYLGSMLFTRGVLGARVVCSNSIKTIDGFNFKNWGSHTSNSMQPYLTVAAAIGISLKEIDYFMDKLKDCWKKTEPNQSRTSNI